jgi:hypothetical protein
MVALGALEAIEVGKILFLIKSNSNLCYFTFRHAEKSLEETIPR